MIRLPPPRPLALLLLPLAAACGGAVLEPDEQIFAGDEAADLAAGLTPSCAGAPICSGSGATYASLLRVGATATARGLALQTFTADEDRVPSEVRLALRSLRPYAGSEAPGVWAELFDVTGQAVPTPSGTAIASGSVPASDVTASAATVVPFTTTGTILKGRTYALRVSTDPVGSGMILFGVATFASDAAWAGEGASHVANQRRTDAQATFAPTRMRPFGPTDIAFALVAPLAFNPSAAVRDPSAEGEPALTSIAFADTYTGNTSAARAVKLVNTGNAALSLGTVASGAPFSTTNSTCAATLAVGASCTFDVAFAPASVGAATGSLTIPITAGQVDLSRAIPLSATGLNGACALPWGGSTANNTSVTAYAVASPPAGSSCTPETRTCANGVLSGTYVVQTCTAVVTLALQAGTYRTWSDGSLATSCSAYRTGDALHLYSGATGDGLYRVQFAGGASNVYCDMTTDNGGWMQTFYSTGPTSTAQDLLMGQIAVREHPLKTVTSNATTRPVVPTGTTNAFTQVLFRGGNASWQAEVGTWVRFSTFANGATVATAFNGVLTSRGGSALYQHERGWGTTSVSPAATFGLWDDPGISNICGGANTGYGKNCPHFGWGQSSYPFHYDTSSARELYVR